MSDFEVRKFYAYRGPSYYLDRRALVFNLSIDPDGPGADHYREAVVEKLPALGESYPEQVAELFAAALVQVMKMDIDLCVDRYGVRVGAVVFVAVGVYLLVEGISRV